MDRPTAREQALQEVVDGRTGNETALHHLFLAILKTITTNDQSVVDRYFDSLKSSFHIEFRMAEWWLLEKEINEYPDGPDDLFHAAEENQVWWENEGREISETLDRQLDEALVLIGITADPDADEQDEGDDNDEDSYGFGTDPDILGGIPN